MKLLLPELEESHHNPSGQAARSKLDDGSDGEDVLREPINMRFNAVDDPLDKIISNTRGAAPRSPLPALKETLKLRAIQMGAPKLRDNRYGGGSPHEPRTRCARYAVWDHLQRYQLSMYKHSK